MDPTFITVSMFNVNPAAFAFKDSERDSFFDGENNFIVRSGSGADIARVIFGNHRRNFAHKRLMHPSLVAFKILKMIPFSGFFNDPKWEKFFYFP
jgi:hypothetical protein